MIANFNDRHFELKHIVPKHWPSSAKSENNYPSII